MDDATNPDSLRNSSAVQDEEENFTPWKSGDPYTFSLDEEVRKAQATRTENPWKVVQEYYTTREEVRCDAWKDEVQHLLIFSGLFSAVVTAFLIESYKTLQQDPSEVSVMLLSRISTQLESLSNATQTSHMPTLSPPPLSSSRRVNSFWFLSLVFSLTSALVSIVAMQWIREHLRPPPQGLSRRKRAPLIHMNIEALDRFRVPEIFTALPLLLLIGLVLFFVGLVDFLWNLDQTVAIPSLAAIVLTLLFLVLSTLLPGLLTLPLYLKPKAPGTLPRIPCAYKSPQAWAFLRLLLAIKRCFKYAAMRLHEGFLGSSTLPLDSLKIISSEKGMKVDWVAHDILWLRQRDIDKLVEGTDGGDLLSTLRTPSYRLSSIYDSVHALLKMKENLPSGRRDELAAVYKCFYELTTFGYGREPRLQRELLCHVIHNLLIPEDPERMNSFLLPMEKLETDPSPPKSSKKRGSRSQIPVLLDLTRLLFATYATPNDCLLARTLTLQHVEICLRLTFFVFAGLPRKLPDLERTTLTPHLALVDGYFAENEIPTDVRFTITKQVLHILSQFFTLVCQAPHRIVPHDNTSHTSRYTSEFLSAAGRILSFNMKDETIQREHDMLVSTIAHHIQASGRADYLFLTASIYAEGFCRRPHSTRSSRLHNHKMARINHLLTTLREYKPGFHKRDGDSDVRRLLKCFSLQRGFWSFMSKFKYSGQYMSGGTVDQYGDEGSGSRHASRASTWPSEYSSLGHSDPGVLSPVDTILEDPVDQGEDGLALTSPYTPGFITQRLVLASPEDDQFPQRQDVEKGSHDTIIDIISSQKVS